MSLCINYYFKTLFNCCCVLIITFKIFILSMSSLLIFMLTTVGSRRLVVVKSFTHSCSIWKVVSSPSMGYTKCLCRKGKTENMHIMLEIQGN